MPSKRCQGRLSWVVQAARSHFSKCARGVPSGARWLEEPPVGLAWPFSVCNLCYDLCVDALLFVNIFFGLGWPFCPPCVPSWARPGEPRLKNTSTVIESRFLCTFGALIPRSKPKGSVTHFWHVRTISKQFQTSSSRRLLMMTRSSRSPSRRCRRCPCPRESQHRIRACQYS